MKEKGRLFIISGPSGCGKDTLLKTYFDRHEDVEFSVSTITRPKRDKSDDEKYSFVTVEAFKELIEQNRLLEYAEYCGNFYGTPKEPIEKWISEGKDVLVEVETVGAEKIKAEMPEAISIFILPPSVELLKKRLSGRATETPEQLEKRLDKAIEEMKKSVFYDYIVVNDSLEQAAEVFERIILSDRQKTERNINFINEVLKNA